MKSQKAQKTWISPMLTVLVRENSRSQESVLALCKYDVSTSGAQPIYTGCKSQPVADWTYCMTQCDAFNPS